MTASESIDTDRRSKWRRRLFYTGVALVLLAVVSYVAATPLLTAFGDQLIHADPPERVDAIIVLAPAFDRVIEAAELYRAGYAPRILLTQQMRQPGEQGLIDRGIIQSVEDVRRDILVSLGVPPESVAILDGFVDSTADEARRFAGWVQQHPIRSAMVVSSPHHTRRSQLTFQRALERLNVKVLVRPSSMGRFRSADWWQRRDTLREGVLEMQRLIYYRLVELPRLEPVAPLVQEAS